MSDFQRLYGLDVLRGVAILLGIVLHGVIAYMAGIRFVTWVDDTQVHSFFFDWLYLFINSFRMQLFFALAGFFSHLVINRKGEGYFLSNRFKRIFIPFFLSYFTIIPLTLVPYLYYQYSLEYANPLAELKRFFIDFFLFKQHSGLMHLWFLYYLLLFYFVLILGRKVLGYFDFKSRLRILFPGGSFGHLFFAALCIGGVTLFFNSPIPTIWTGFRVQWPQFFYYGAFYFFGWKLLLLPEMLNLCNRWFKIFLITGLLLSVIHVCFLNGIGVPSHWIHSYLVLFKATFAIQTVLLIAGFIGFFNVYFNYKSNFSRYLADSAYWVYLIHLPLVLFFQLILLDSFVPGWLRFPVVIGIATTLAYLSYHFLVRKKWIGHLLNGKRE